MEKLAAIYIRVSTQEQRKGWSPSGQRNACLQSAQEAGFAVPAEFIFDEGISGEFWNRPLFTKLRQCVRERKVGAVFIQFSDRIARKAWQQLRFLEECQQAGVALYVGGQLVDDSRSGRLLFGIRSSLDEDSRALLLERTKQGKEQRARAGLPNGGQVPFGYNLVYRSPRHSEWVVNEQEAHVVRQIYRWYAHEGETILGIARRLSRMKIPTKSDTEHKHSKQRPFGEWAYSSVQHILTYDGYTGTAYQRRNQIIERALTVDGIGTERIIIKKVKRPKDGQIEFNIPPIISVEDFEAVQARLKRNKQLSPRNMKYQYLLRSVWFKCSCGKSMTGVVHKRGPHSYRYYRCVSQQGRHFGTTRCPGMVSADDCEQEVLSAIERVMLDPERIDTYIQRQQGDSSEEMVRLRQEMEDYKRALNNCEDEWLRLLEMASTWGVSNDDMSRYKQRLDLRRHDIREHLRQCEERIASLGVKAEQIRSLVAYVARVRTKQLVAAAHAAVKAYPTWDMEPQLVDSITDAVEKWDKQEEQFHTKWETMTPEQRQRVEAQWGKRQVREKLQSMTIDEKQHLFDALGLRVEWRRGQPLKISLALACEDTTNTSKLAGR